MIADVKHVATLLHVLTVTELSRIAAVTAAREQVSAVVHARTVDTRERYARICFIYKQAEKPSVSSTRLSSALVRSAELVRSALAKSALVSPAFVRSALVSSALVSSALVSSALASSALVSTALVSFALMRSALVSYALKSLSYSCKIK